MHPHEIVHRQRAKAYAARNSGKYGIRTGETVVEWNVVRQRVEGIVAGMREMNRKNFTTSPKLDFILGTARFIDQRVVEVRELQGGTRRITAEKIFINTGTRPATPDLPGQADLGPLALNSESIQRVEMLPRHLVILAGSYVALEFAQMFRFLGSEVTVLERDAQLLKHEDEDVVEAFSAVLHEDGIDLRLNCAAECVERDEDGCAIALNENGKASRVSASHLLLTVGRAPNTEEPNLAAIGVDTNKRGFVRVNERLETSVSGIWALGDVNGGPQFTHASLDDYRIVKANVFDNGKRTTSDRLVPFTHRAGAGPCGHDRETGRQQGFGWPKCRSLQSRAPRR